MFDPVREFLKGLKRSGFEADLKRHKFALSKGERKRLKHRLAIKRLRKAEKRKAEYEPCR